MSATKLKFLYAKGRDVLRCSANDFLIVSDWFALNSSNISCPNQVNLFESNTPKFIRNQTYFIQYNQSSLRWLLSLKAYYVKKKEDTETNICQPSIKKLWTIPYPNITGVITDTHLSHKFEAVCVDSALYIDLGYKDSGSDLVEDYTIYMIFDQQPMICRITFNHAAFTKDKKHHNDSKIITTRLCYYDPQSNDSKIAVDWNFIETLVWDPSYGPNNWTMKGGYYHNNQLEVETTSVSLATTMSTEYPTSSSPSPSSSVGDTTDLISSIFSSDTTVMSSNTGATLSSTSSLVETSSPMSMTSDASTLAASTATSFVETSIISSTEGTLSTMSTTNDYYTTESSFAPTSVISSISMNSHETLSSSSMTICTSESTLTSLFGAIVTGLINTTKSTSKMPSNKTITTKKSSATTYGTVSTTQFHATVLTTSWKLFQKKPLAKNTPASPHVVYTIVSVVVLAIVGSLGLIIFQCRKSNPPSLFGRNRSNNSLTTGSILSSDSSSTTNSEKMTSKHKVSQQAPPLADYQHQQALPNNGRIFTHIDPDSI